MIASLALLGVGVLAASQSACAGGNQPAAYEIPDDSTSVVGAGDSREVINSQELLYELPDSVFAIEYEKAYYMPPPTSSAKKPWRKLEKLAVSPDGNFLAVVANDGAGVDILLKRLSDSKLFVVGWWHHLSSDSLYWSPDSRFLLMAIDDMGERSRIVILDVLPGSSDPVKQVIAWESDNGWKFDRQAPEWNLPDRTATITLHPVPMESSTSRSAATSGNTMKKTFQLRENIPPRRGHLNQNGVWEDVPASGLARNQFEERTAPARSTNTAPRDISTLLAQADLASSNPSLKKAADLPPKSAEGSARAAKGKDTLTAASAPKQATTISGEVFELDEKRLDEHAKLKEPIATPTESAARSGLPDAVMRPESRENRRGAHTDMESRPLPQSPKLQKPIDEPGVNSKADSSKVETSSPAQPEEER